MRKIFLVLAVVVMALAAIRFIGCPRLGPSSSDYYYPLAGEYLLLRNSGDNVKISPEVYDASTPVIPSLVVEVAWDKRFILAKRLEMQSNNGLSGKPIPGSKKTIVEWWILDTSNSQLFGPYNKTEFVMKRKELGVPSTLALMPVDSYKP